MLLHIVLHLDRPRHGQRKTRLVDPSDGLSRYRRVPTLVLSCMRTALHVVRGPSPECRKCPHGHMLVSCATAQWGLLTSPMFLYMPLLVLERSGSACSQAESCAKQLVTRESDTTCQVRLLPSQHVWPAVVSGAVRDVAKACKGLPGPCPEVRNGRQPLGLHRVADVRGPAGRRWRRVAPKGNDLRQHVAVAALLVQGHLGEATSESDRALRLFPSPVAPARRG